MEVSNVDLISQFLRSDLNRRHNLLLRLIGANYPTAIAIIRLAITDRHELIRGTAIEQLQEIGRPRDAFYAVFCLRDDAWVVRADAAQCLGILRTKQGFKRLSQCLLQDSHAHVRKYAAIALTEYGASAEGILLSSSRSERNSFAKVGIFEGLVKLGHSEFSDPLLELLQTTDELLTTNVSNALQQCFHFLSQDAIRNLIDILPQLLESGSSRMEMAARELQRAMAEGGVFTDI